METMYTSPSLEHVLARTFLFSFRNFPMSTRETCFARKEWMACAWSSHLQKLLRDPFRKRCGKKRRGMRVGPLGGCCFWKLLEWFVDFFVDQILRKEFVSSQKFKSAVWKGLLLRKISWTFSEIGWSCRFDSFLMLYVMVFSCVLRQIARRLSPCQSKECHQFLGSISLEVGLL